MHRVGPSLEQTLRGCTDFRTKCWACKVMPAPKEVAVFRVEPEVISVLDYTKGFGHADLVTLPRSATAERGLLSDPTGTGAPQDHSRAHALTNGISSHSVV